MVTFVIMYGYPYMVWKQSPENLMELFTQRFSQWKENNKEQQHYEHAQNKIEKRKKKQ